MWPIVACSVVALAIIIERWVKLILVPRQPDLATLVAEAIQSGDKDQAQALCEASPGPVAAVLSEICGATHLSGLQFEQLAQTAGSRELRALQAHLRALSSIARVAPLLGLLGTVAGMVEAFMVVSKHGGRVDPSLLAEGISRALLTTVAGLIVAIPATLFLDWFEGRIDGVAFSLTEAVTKVVSQAGERPGAAGD